MVVPQAPSNTIAKLIMLKITINNNNCYLGFTLYNAKIIKANKSDLSIALVIAKGLSDKMIKLTYQKSVILSTVHQ
ncbi:hypothetical protein [Orientia tsutsugamushi]|uniref:hypothetical protein n=1 Tax=Orientia tsutsugamushi TaxID=784 RepID=UPI003528B67F